jgi:sugar phosphate isomerase/epimerase
MDRISLASGVVPELDPADTIRAASAGGFDAVGLWIEPPRWTGAMARKCRQALAATGLSVLDVEVVWFKPGPPDLEHLRVLDIGAEVGARHVLVVSSDPDMSATAAKLATLCTHAEPLGQRICLEFGLFTEVKTIHQALSVIAAAAHPLAGLLIDPLHLARSGGTPEDVAGVSRELMPYAQICDAPASGPAPDDADGILREAIDERLQCGEGGLPLAAVLGALPADIPLSVELRSKPLRESWPDPQARARATAEATRRFLAAHGKR